MNRPLRFALVIATALVTSAPLGAQTRRPAPAQPPSDSASSLKMRETGIQGEHQRPDVLFVIPTGRGAPIISPRLRDYSYDIQEPVVKMWLEGELRIAHQAPPAREGVALDWREVVQQAAKAPPPARPEPLPMQQTRPRTSEPGVPREAMQSAPRTTAPGIPSEARQFPRR